MPYNMKSSGLGGSNAHREGQWAKEVSTITRSVIRYLILRENALKWDKLYLDLILL